MGKLILILILFAVPLYALIEAVRSPADEVRVMSKWLWALLVLFLGIIGAVLWFVFGRPRMPAPGGDGSGGGGISLPPGLGPRPKGPVAPDDDPEFLKRLDEATWAARMEKLRKERGGAASGDGAPPAPPPTPQPAPRPAPEPGPDPT